VLDTLFCGESLGDWLREREQRARKAIDGLPAERVLSQPIEELVEEMYPKFTVAAPQLTGERHQGGGVKESSMELSAPFVRLGFGSVKSHRVTVHVVFQGDAAIFGLRPSTHTLSPPRGHVVGNEVLVTVEQAIAQFDAAQAKHAVDTEIASIEKYLGFADVDCRGFNANLKGTLAEALAGRRRVLEQARELERALGIPVHRRPDPDPGLAVEVVRRRPVPVSAAASRESEPDEPFIRDEDFTALVQHIASAQRLVERLPETFSRLSEESLRDILLVLLNNTFGPATGESFSGSGKTDIFVPFERGPVFIAECKFWKGPAAFRAAIDQLLGYLVWRDTKAALVIFVRQRDVTGAQRAAIEELRTHARYVRDGAAVDGHSVVLLHHEGDKERLVRIALVVVALPRSPDHDG
jgi:hypothetical protein